MKRVDNFRLWVPRVFKTATQLLDARSGRRYDYSVQEHLAFTTEPMRVLLIEDNPADAELVRENLQRQQLRPMKLVHVERLEQALGRLGSGSFDVALLDLSLPDAWELDGLKRLCSAAPTLPIVVLTGSSDPALGIEAVAAGAQDYLWKGEVDAPILARSLSYAIERHRHVRRAQLLGREQAARAAAEDAHERSLLLAEASTALAYSLDIEETLANAARVLVPSFGDCTMWILDDSSLLGGDRILEIWADTRGAGTMGAAEDIEYVRGLVAAVRQPMVRSSAPDSTAAEIDKYIASRTRNGRDFRSWVAAPIVVRGELVGTMLFMATQRQYAWADVLWADDVARRTALAVENARLYRQARQAIEARNEFLAVASHELRTPLTALHLLLESLQRILARECGRGPEHDDRWLLRKFEVAIRQTTRLGRLINGLLDASRIMSGQLRLELEMLDLSDVVREAAERFEADARAAGCTLEVQTVPVLGRWDRLRVEQILTNLVSNALKYAPGARIEIAVEPDGDSAKLTVRDHGIGIAKADLDRIFGPFERAVSVRQYGGLGLGLFVVRQIVEAHGGAIEVSSQPNEGALFTVRLPRGIPAQSKMAETESASL